MVLSIVGVEFPPITISPDISEKSEEISRSVFSTSDKMSSDVLNSFSQACTIFTGQNYGAGQLKR